MANNGRMPSRNRGARGNMKMDADSLKILKRTFSYVWKVYGFKLIIFVICILLAAAKQLVQSSLLKLLTMLSVQLLKIMYLSLSYLPS